MCNHLLIEPVTYSHSLSTFMELLNEICCRLGRSAKIRSGSEIFDNQFDKILEKLATCWSNAENSQAFRVSPNKWKFTHGFICVQQHTWLYFYSKLLQTSFNSTHQCREVYQVKKVSMGLQLQLLQTFTTCNNFAKLVDVLLIMNRHTEFCKTVNTEDTPKIGPFQAQFGHGEFILLRHVLKIFMFIHQTVQNWHFDEPVKRDAG